MAHPCNWYSIACQIFVCLIFVATANDKNMLTAKISQSTVDTAITAKNQQNVMNFYRWSYRERMMFIIPELLYIVWHKYCTCKNEQPNLCVISLDLIKALWQYFLLVFSSHLRHILYAILLTDTTVRPINVTTIIVHNNKSIKHWVQSNVINTEWWGISWHWRQLIKHI